MVVPRLPTARLLGCALLVGLGFAPRATAAQASGGPLLSPNEAEAQRMAQEMSFMCSPQRHRDLGDSRSMIRRDAGDLEGTAGLVRTAEGTFLVLEGYDDNQAGHCLVLAWFGGELHAGTYAIRQLTMAAVEEEVGAEEHSFFVFSAVRSPEESSMLVTSSGSLVIEEMAGIADRHVRAHRLRNRERSAHGRGRARGFVCRP